MRRSESAATANKLQAKARVEFAVVVFSTTRETRDSAAHAPHARKFLFAAGTAINESRGVSSRRERQMMTALLVADFQVMASLPPLVAMRQDSATPGAKLGKNMRQFMSQSAIDFGRMRKQARV